MPNELPELPDGYGWSHGPDGELGLVKVVHEIDKDSRTRERDIHIASLQVWRKEHEIVGMLMETDNPTHLPVTTFSAMALFEGMDPAEFAKAYSDLTGSDEPGTPDPTSEQVDTLRKALPAIIEVVVEGDKTYTVIDGRRKRVIVLSTVFCGVCGEPQFQTPSGAACANGHGGAPSVNRPEKAEQWKA